MANKKESSEIVFLEPIKPIKEIDVRDIGFPIALGKTKDGGAAPIFFDRESKSWKPAPNLTVGAVLDAERFFGD
tara:strand:+ start:1357 stop:1578 length:222 start_codon:yes stop_codon:yes gene_type:complete